MGEETGTHREAHDAQDPPDGVLGTARGDQSADRYERKDGKQRNREECERGPVPALERDGGAQEIEQRRQRAERHRKRPRTPRKPSGGAVA